MKRKKISDVEWSDFIKETRKGLGLTRKDFSALFGISIETLNNWEYRDQIPPPMYQDAILALHENSDQAKGIIGQDAFWRDVAKGAFVVGVILLLCKVFSEKDQ